MQAFHASWGAEEGEGMPVDSHLDILNGITTVEGPHGVSLGGGKQHCGCAQRPLQRLQPSHNSWCITTFMHQFTT